MLAAHVQLYIHFCLFYLFVKEYVCTCYSAVAEYKVNRNNKRGCWNREHTKGQLLICHRSKGLTWMTPSCVSLKLGRTIYYICWFRHMVSQEKDLLANRINNLVITIKKSTSIYPHDRIVTCIHLWLLCLSYWFGGSLSIINKRTSIQITTTPIKRWENISYNHLL